MGETDNHPKVCECFPLVLSQLCDRIPNTFSNYTWHLAISLKPLARPSSLPDRKYVLILIVVVIITILQMELGNYKVARDLLLDMHKDLTSKDYVIQRDLTQLLTYVCGCCWCACCCFVNVYACWFTCPVPTRVGHCIHMYWCVFLLSWVIIMEQQECC